MDKLALHLHFCKVKVLSASGGFAPWLPHQGLCPWTPLSTSPSDPRYRLALAMSASKFTPIKTHRFDIGASNRQTDGRTDSRFAWRPVAVGIKGDENSPTFVNTLFRTAWTQWTALCELRDTVPSISTCTEPAMLIRNMALTGSGCSDCDEHRTAQFHVRVAFWTSAFIDDHSTPKTVGGRESLVGKWCTELRILPGSTWLMIDIRVVSSNNTSAAAAFHSRHGSFQTYPRCTMKYETSGPRTVSVARGRQGRWDGTLALRCKRHRHWWS